MTFASGLPRQVEPELLDDLPADDPRAQRSRLDLRRIHRAMSTLSILQRALDVATVASPPRRMLELGAGDGSLMLRLATLQAPRWHGVSLDLLDRLDLVDEATLASFRQLGWSARALPMDVFAWLQAPVAQPWDVICANLFLHHFRSDELRLLLAGIASRTGVFVCCEPRRETLPLAASHLVALLGANAVTRQDAVLSVHAGFRAQELSALWPDPANWHLREYRAGLFGHAFVAVRRSASA
ncbi:hypothetical protein BH11PSE14_BH11PSE14_09250 [soil metagenome]